MIEAKFLIMAGLAFLAIIGFLLVAGVMCGLALFIWKEVIEFWSDHFQDDDEEWMR